MGRVNDMTIGIEQDKITEEEETFASDYEEKPIKTRIQFHLNFMVVLLNAGRDEMAKMSLERANELIEGAIITKGKGQ